MRDVNENLGNQIVAATELSRHLSKQLAEGDGVLRRLSRIALAARPASAQETESAEQSAPADARSVAAAARAFSERRRASGLAA